jgi:toxin ParE1/3/4
VKTVSYLPAADADLVGIWHYTAEEWGVERADRYVTEIRKRIEGLTTGATASRSADDVRKGLRRAISGRHVVFFRESGARIEVVRVLHQSMDVGRWF